MADGDYVDGSVWFYAPNKGAPVFFAVAFLASGACHAWQTRHYKSWRLTGQYVFCALLFTAGFVVREMGAFDDGHLIKYIVSVCLVYAGPPLFELANYHILGHVLYFVPYHSLLHPGRVLSTFAMVSAVIEALNSNGIAYFANQALPQRKRETGKALLKAALLMQILVVALFLLLAGHFHLRCRRHGIRSAKVGNVLVTLYVSSSLIAARTVYRIVEYWHLSELDFWDPDLDPAAISPLIRFETFFYVFDAGLMLLNSVLFNVRHPRRWLPASTNIYLARDGVSELVGPGYKQDRSFLATLVDPFDLWGLITGRDKQTRFWPEDGATDTQEGKGTESHEIPSTAGRGPPSAA